MAEQNINGWLNIDKPFGFSSAKVVAIIKRLLKAKKVGHGGTLDPLATGVLPICINKATKTTEKMMGFDKEYLFEITFGESRTTADAEGDVLETSSKIPTESEILEAIPKFLGVIKQVPPIYSAIKVDGKRAYELARNNKDVELKPRDVKVYSFDFLGFTSERSAKFKIKCGKGFYIRSVAVDLSKALETVGYISYLRRISVGIFNQDNILTIEDVEKLVKSEKIQEKLIEI